MRNRTLLLLCGMSSLITAPTLMAQTAERSGTASAPAPSGELEDIIVTARRREESLQNVPVTVVAISKAALANNDATDLSKLAELAPQVLIGRAVVGTGGLITIRGISSSASDAGLNQSASVVVDGVPLSRGRIVTASLFDMQQAQIMEGPQALFFGKNSPAGVIDLKTTDPSGKLEGYIKAGYEFIASERYGEGAVSLPITDTLSARVAFRLDYMDGWIKNDAQPVADPFHPGVMLPGPTNGNTTPQGHDNAVRTTVLWTPTSDFEAKLKLTYDSERNNSNDPDTQLFCTGGQTAPSILGVPVPNGSCAKNMRITETSEAPIYAANFPYSNGGVPYGDTDFYLGSLNLNYKLDPVTLTSTTGYYYQNYQGGFDADYSPFAEIWDTQSELYQLVTQELRASTDFSGPLNFMAGVYYEHSNRPLFNAPDLFHTGLNPAANNYATVETTARNTSKSYSGFFQARWNIIPSLELAAGARYSKDVEDSVLANPAVNPTTTFSFYPVGSSLPVHYSGSNTSPEVTLTWHPSSHQTLYGAYKTGYKAGGVSNGSLLFSDATASSLTFGAERTKGGEIGYKADLLNRTLRIDVTAYFYNYDGLQLATFYAPDFGFNIKNAAAARTQGIESTFEWLATEGLTFHGSLGYNKARYLTFGNAQCYAGQTAAQGCVSTPTNPSGAQDISGQPLNRAPNVTFDLGGDYKAHFASGWFADMSVDGAYTSQYQSAADNNPGGIQPAFWRLNAAVHIGPEDGKYEIALIGRNLTNSYYLINTNSAPAGTATEYVAQFDRPREVVIEGQYRF